VDEGDWIMTELKELIALVVKKKIPDADIFDSEVIARKEPQYQLFSGIKASKYHSLEEAATAIYKGKASDNNFKLIRSRLKQRLISALVSVQRPFTQ
jgi:hypothetical protein